MCHKYKNGELRYKFNNRFYRVKSTQHPTYCYGDDSIVVDMTPLSFMNSTALTLARSKSDKKTAFNPSQVVEVTIYTDRTGGGRYAARVRDTVQRFSRDGSP